MRCLNRKLNRILALVQKFSLHFRLTTLLCFDSIIKQQYYGIAQLYFFMPLHYYPRQNSVDFTCHLGSFFFFDKTLIVEWEQLKIIWTCAFQISSSRQSTGTKLAWKPDAFFFLYFTFCCNVLGLNVWETNVSGLKNLYNVINQQIPQTSLKEAIKKCFQKEKNNYYIR